jgi:hypothetical protein
VQTLQLAALLITLPHSAHTVMIRTLYRDRSVQILRHIHPLIKRRQLSPLTPQLLQYRRSELLYLMGYFGVYYTAVAATDQRPCCSNHCMVSGCLVHGVVMDKIRRDLRAIRPLPVDTATISFRAPFIVVRVMFQRAVPSNSDG